MAERSTPRYIWAEDAPPGPAPALSRDKIVEVAIAIADAEGLDALSMRRLGAELSVRPMSLYRHVPSKDDLLELINDAVLGGSSGSRTSLPATGGRTCGSPRPSSARWRCGTRGA